MTILNAFSNTAGHISDVSGPSSEFSRLVDQAHDLLAAMEAQQQTLDNLLARSRKAIYDSRALLMVPIRRVPRGQAVAGGNKDVGGLKFGLTA